MAGEATYRLGNSVKVTIGDNTIGGQQDCTLTMESDTGETTTKDSGMWSDAEVTGLSWSVDCSGLIPVSDAAVTALETAWKAGNKVTIKYGNPNLGAFIFPCSIASFQSLSSTLQSSLASA